MVDRRGSLTIRRPDLLRQASLPSAFIRGLSWWLSQFPLAGASGRAAAPWVRADPVRWPVASTRRPEGWVGWSSCWPGLPIRGRRRVEKFGGHRSPPQSAHVGDAKGDSHRDQHRCRHDHEPAERIEAAGCRSPCLLAASDSGRTEVPPERSTAATRRSAFPRPPGATPRSLPTSALRPSRWSPARHAWARVRVWSIPFGVVLGQVQAARRMKARSSTSSPMERP